MRRLAISLLLILVAVGTGGAAATCGGGTGGSRDPIKPQPPAGFGVQVADPDWVVELRARDKEEFPAKRPVDCLVTGFAANGDVVRIEDERGRTAEYKIDMKGTTPINLGVTNAGGVDVIEIYCSMEGSIGESLRCRIRSRGGGRPALLPGIDFNIIDRGKTTFCTVNISAGS